MTIQIAHDGSPPWTRFATFASVHKLPWNSPYPTVLSYRYHDVMLWPATPFSRKGGNCTTILLAITLAEALETQRIHYVVGLADGPTALLTKRPYRLPHQTISDVGLIGGGHVPLSGEVSLAHHGALRL